MRANATGVSTSNGYTSEFCWLVILDIRTTMESPKYDDNGQELGGKDRHHSKMEKPHFAPKGRDITFA